MEVTIMKNRYNYPPGLFGIGFIAAGFSARPIDVQPEETRARCNGPGQTIAKSHSDQPKAKKIQAWQRKRER